MSQYKDLLVSKESQKLQFQAAEYKVSSQNGEDGILLYIFSKIGVTNRITIEFGVGDGSQCNSLNLIVNFGFRGLFIEANSEDVGRGKKLLEQNGVTDHKFQNSFVTTENINELFESNGISGEIDLLNIDIDGNDYWIWECIEKVNPRVVVLEYNSSFGPKASLTVPYKADFNRWNFDPSGWYHGASLTALTKLGEKKGYDLVACDSFGVNAFFVRKDINIFSATSPEESYYPEVKRLAKAGSLENQMKILEKYPLVEV